MKQDIIESDLEDIFCREIPWKQLENKTVLVTGAYGMLASYIVYTLIYLNEVKKIHVNIIAVGRSEEKLAKRFGNIEKYGYLKFLKSDLSSELSVGGNIDYIIHAASLASPQYYKVCPVEVLKPNIIGHYHLLELAARKQVESYLLFSSGDIYGFVTGIDQISENHYGTMDPLDIHSCYGESKRMAETMCRAWFEEKRVPAKIVRIAHTYSPTMDIESDPRVFASFVKDIVYKKNIVMKSDGHAKRNFCYITDAVAAYFLVLLHGKNGEAYNVSNPHEFYSIRELAEILVRLYPELGLSVVTAIRNRGDAYIENKAAHNIPVDSSKLEALGWEARCDVRTGFRKVIESIKDEQFVGRTDIC